jgi:EAL domain-containing protein (putative c-di-GMP-specific phosphodiesterase class I)
MMSESSSAAAAAASHLLDSTVLLKGAWQELSRRDRDRLLSEMVLRAAALRNSLSPATRRSQGPTSEDVRSELEAPTAALYVQPIVRLSTGDVVGFEALSRFPTWSPDRWFNQAWDSGIGLEFEIVAVERAMSALRTLPDHVFLAINVSPLTLVSSVLFKKVISSEPHRIALELTEHQPIRDYTIYRDRVATLRGRGVRIAVDDVGAGHSSLQHIIQLSPDMLKLDRGLVAGCDQDPVRRVLTACFTTWAGQTEMSLVAEGIETAGEARTLASSGIAFGQGHFFGRPRRLSPSGRPVASLATAASRPSVDGPSGPGPVLASPSKESSKSR